MEDETQLIPEIIQVITHEDGKSAVCNGWQDNGKKYRIQEIMLGAGPMRKCIPWTERFLKADTECRAEILQNGRLRII